MGGIVNDFEEKQHGRNGIAMATAKVSLQRDMRRRVRATGVLRRDMQRQRCKSIGRISLKKMKTEKNRVQFHVIEKK